jgi:hypothetical protein
MRHRLYATAYYAVTGALALTVGLLSNVYMAKGAHATGVTCYGGGAVGWSGAFGKATETDDHYYGPTDINVVDSFGAQGETFTALAGCDLPFAGSKFGVGILGDFSWHNADFTAGEVGDDPDVATGLDTSWMIGGRLFYNVTPGAMVYILAGYSQAELADLTFDGDDPIGLPTLEGYVVGGGTEVDLGRNLALQVQGTYAMYDTASVDLGYGDSLDLDVDVLTARVGLVLRLNGTEDPFAAAKPLK